MRGCHSPDAALYVLGHVHSMLCAEYNPSRVVAHKIFGRAPLAHSSGSIRPLQRMGLSLKQDRLTILCPPELALQKLRPLRHLCRHIEDVAVNDLLARTVRTLEIGAVGECKTRVAVERHDRSGLLHQPIDEVDRAQARQGIKVGLACMQRLWPPALCTSYGLEALLFPHQAAVLTIP